MIGKIIDFIIGKASFDIMVKDSRDMAVLNLLKESGIYECSVSEGRVTFSCGCTLAKSVSQKLENLGVPYESRITGLWYFLKKLLYRPGISVGCIVCIILNHILGGTLFKIDVVGNEKIDKNEIIRKLETFDVYEGCRISGINIKKLSRDYMLSDDRLSFVHMNIKGTKAVVEVAEAAVKGEVENTQRDKKEVCNIVAKCDGVITRLDVYSGGREVENGQSVAKGQLLISSFFETRTVGYLLRRARGVAFARTEPVFEMWLPQYGHVQKNDTAKIKTSLAVAGRTIPVNGFFPWDENGKISLVKHEKEPAVFGVLKIPCKLIVREYNVGEYEKRKRSQNEAETICKKEFENWKKKLGNSAEILSEETEICEKDGYYVFVGKLSCVESIGIDKPFEIRGN